MREISKICRIIVVLLMITILTVTLAALSACGKNNAATVPGQSTKAPASSSPGGSPLTKHYQKSLNPGEVGGLISDVVRPGGRISLTYTVKGGDKNDILFTVISPEGGQNSLGPEKNYDSGEYNGSTQTSGRFVFRWDNSFDQANAKSIEATYSIWEDGQ